MGQKTIDFHSFVCELADESCAKMKNKNETKMKNDNNNNEHID